jgi:hypothetical protein
VWLNNETRVRPSKAVQDLHDYFEYQDKQVKQMHIDAKELPDGMPQGRKQ